MTSLARGAPQIFASGEQGAAYLIRAEGTYFCVRPLRKMGCSRYNLRGKEVILMQERRRVAHPPHHSFWGGMAMGSLPFLLLLGITIRTFLDQKDGSIFVDQDIHFAFYLYGTELLAAVACLLIKRLRHVGTGLFTSLFFTPVIVLVLSLLMVFITGSVF
jgi:hypothetical protein